MGSRAEADRTRDEAGETVLPLLAEEVAVTKRVVETGRVQVARITHEREQLIDELLAQQTADIERVRIGQPVDTMPAVREEGDTVVIPIVEEVLVVERRLFLKEEVRVRRVHSTQRHQESVTLRHHEAVVTRLPVEPPAAGETAGTGGRVQQSKEEGEL
jgi:stress response protein YsnF